MLVAYSRQAFKRCDETEISMEPESNEHVPASQESSPALRETFLGDIGDETPELQTAPEIPAPRKTAVSRRLSGIVGTALVLVVIFGFLSIILLQTQSAAPRSSGV